MNRICPDCAAVADATRMMMHKDGCYQAAILDEQLEADKAWFARFPNERVHRRKPNAQEVRIFRDLNHLPDDVVVRGAVVVRQLLPGVVHRHFDMAALVIA